MSIHLVIFSFASETGCQIEKIVLSQLKVECGVQYTAQLEVCVEADSLVDSLSCLVVCLLLKLQPRSCSRSVYLCREC